MKWIDIVVSPENKGNIPYDTYVLLRFKQGAYIASKISYDDEFGCDSAHDIENYYSVFEFSHYCLIINP